MTGRHYLRALISSAALLSVALAAFACGGDDDDRVQALPAAQYFSRVDSIFQDADTRSNEIESQFDDARQKATTLDEELRAIDEFLTASIANFQQAIVKLEALAPPAALQESHERFLNAARDTVRVSQDFLEKLGGVETRREADDLINTFDTDASPIIDRADQACSELQNAAEAQNIDVDLDCSD